MSKGIAALTAGTLSLLLLLSFGTHSLDEEKDSVRIMFYNTENLFDIMMTPLPMIMSSCRRGPGDGIIPGM